MKSHRFDVLSDKKCKRPRCDKRLKLRLVETKKPENITECFNHHKDTRRRKQAKNSRVMV